MIGDARNLEDQSLIDADICVIGAGPAGLTLALELEGRGLRVIVLESGGRGVTRAGQRLARGEVAGQTYFPLDTTRIRGFGGTSNHWRLDSAFRARPLDGFDLVERPEIGLSGWPVDRSDLDDDYATAQRICGLGPPDYATDRWATPSTPPLPVPEDEVQTWIFQTRPPDTFAARWDDVRRMRDVRVLLHATALELRSDDRRVTTVAVTSGGGRRFEVRSRFFVLAQGGIENARLLLLSARDRPAGIGNEHDLVGRYFMEHPHVRSGVFVPARPEVFDRMGMYERHTVDGTDVVGMLAPAPEALRRERALGSAWSIYAVPRARMSAEGQLLSEIRDVITYRAPLPGTAARVARLFSRPRSTARAVLAARAGVGDATVGMLHGMVEQEPNRESRVTLGDRRDRFGQPVARVEWRLTDRDRRSIRVGQDVLDRALRTRGLGHITDRFGETSPPPIISGGYHHIGTTRMNADPRGGVVSPEQRVHSTTNLYVTGTSVFTTGGVANPTLTVVALAARLARHLRADLGAAR